MKTYGSQMLWNIRLIVLIRVILLPAFAQSLDPSFSHQFSPDSYHFSPFGGNKYISLNPGLKKTFSLKKDPDVVIKQTVLNDWEPIPVSGSNGARLVHARILEEQFFEDGGLKETHRSFLARAIETGDVFCFGKQISKPRPNGMDDEIVRAWRYGDGGAGLGLFMPGQALLGSRFYRESGPDASSIKAQLESTGETPSSPVVQVESVFAMKLSSDHSPDDPPQIEWYAAGVGLMARDDFQLIDLEQGTTGLPTGARFVPYSDHPYFPLASGMRWMYEGREDFQDIRVEVVVLPEAREMTFDQKGEVLHVSVAVVESREWIGGGLHEVNRTFYTQSVETGDVFYMGEEVDLYLEGGAIVLHDGSWVAGVDDALPGVIMPGDMVPGARYLQEFVPDISVNQAHHDASGLRVETPLGSFEDCIRIVETSLVFPDELPSPKLYAPGMGLVDDDGTLKLISFEKPTLSSVENHLRIQSAVLLEWPLMDEPFRLELSPDLNSWKAVDTPVHRTPQGFQATVPVASGTAYFRLSSPASADVEANPE